ncbi:helix-turn-helix domain-containing protein [Cereibacter sphaeroides]|uniref:helix-turn-helix transcriptional regulator n=2 Tax=Cereibacter sphaeroides TaxID=1063 RepID=UPI001F40D7BC|nr:helix-turn-helix transcriptional regulator [Cereibacter sphaeroides]MCE6949668.1 helix-turn-helix domain-containing protein [Cereibacter sphaeroides]
MPARKALSKEERHARRAEVARKAAAGELRLPEAFREIRQALGLTQASFAERFGLTRLQVIALEAGKANPTLETLQKIATPFGFQVGFVARGRADVSGDAGG